MLGWVYTSFHFSSNFSSKGESTPVVYMLSPVETMKSHRCQKQKSPMAAATSFWWWWPEPQSPIATKWISSWRVSWTWVCWRCKLNKLNIQPDYLCTCQCWPCAERKRRRGKVKWSEVGISLWSFCWKHWCKGIWSPNIYSNSYHIYLIQFCRNSRIIPFSETDANPYLSVFLSYLWNCIVFSDPWLLMYRNKLNCSSMLMLFIFPRYFHSSSAGFGRHKTIMNSVVLTVTAVEGVCEPNCASNPMTSSYFCLP